MECRKEYLCIDETKHSPILGAQNLEKDKFKQTNTIYIYIHIFTHVSHQESYTGRTARNMTSPEKKTYTCVIPEKDTLYMHKAKE